MRSNKRKLFKKSLKKGTAKILLAGVLSFGLAGATTTTFAQTPPPPPAGGPPTPPPPPGELLNKINPFKKKKAADKNKTADQKKDTAPAKTEAAPAPPAGPPPPPNPLDLFKKKKKTTDPAPKTSGAK
jgi:hypothetical protein